MLTAEVGESALVYRALAVCGTVVVLYPCNIGEVVFMYTADHASSASSPRNASSPLFIRDSALLAPTEPSGLVHGQDILIIDNCIHAVGPTGTLVTPTAESPNVLDARGLLTLPGLINAHTHSRFYARKRFTLQPTSTILLSRY